MPATVKVTVTSNGGKIRSRRQLTENLRAWPFLVVFHTPRMDLAATPTAIGKRVLAVQGLDQPVTVRVFNGRIITQ